MFAEIARTVNRKVYARKAKVIGTTLVTGTDGSISVSLGSLKGDAFSWDDVKELTSVVTISHGGSIDGPNLNYGSGGHNQPWGLEFKQQNGTVDISLNKAGSAFWATIGSELKASGKIILLGCSMGMNGYAGHVAKAAGRSVYAAEEKMAAANEERTVSIVTAIEKGVTVSPMKRFDP